jgi:DNA repair protein RadD
VYHFLQHVPDPALAELVRAEVPELDTKRLSREELERVLFSLHGLDVLARAPVRRVLIEALDEQEVRDLAIAADLDPSKKKYDLAVDLSLKNWQPGTPWVRRLARVLEIPDELLPKRAQREIAVEVVSPFEALPELFPYQRELVGKVHDALLHRRPERFLVQLPTGAGKTRVLMEAIARYLNGCAEGQSQTVLWLAHAEELCDQAVESFFRVWAVAGTYEIRLGRLWGGFRPSVNDLVGAVVVASYQKCIAWSHDARSGFDELAASCRVVVIDEAHKVLAPSIRKLVEHIQRVAQVSTVGLTATPGRGAEDLAGNVALAQFFLGHLVSAPTLGDNPIRTLQEMGVLARVVRREVRTGVRLEETPVNDDNDSTDDLPPWVLSALAKDRERNDLICSLVCEAVRDGLPTLVFCCTVNHAKSLAVMTAIRGLRTGYLDYMMGRGPRRRLVQSFRDGQLDALFNFGVLSTGFDAPNVGCVVIARPTTSIVLYSQMIGRGLRGVRVGGSTAFRLVDVRDNLQAFGKLEEVYGHFSPYWLPKDH